MPTAQPDVQSRSVACLAIPSLALHSELLERPGLAGAPVALSDEARSRVVVVTRPRIVRAQTTTPTVRSAADRTQHLEDAHIVVHGETGASANPRTVEAQAAGDSR